MFPPECGCELRRSLARGSESSVRPVELCRAVSRVVSERTRQCWLFSMVGLKVGLPSCRGSDWAKGWHPKCLDQWHNRKILKEIYLRQLQRQRKRTHLINQKVSCWSLVKTKLTRLLMAVITFVVLAGAVIPASAQVVVRVGNNHRRHHRHYHHRR